MSSPILPPFAWNVHAREPFLQNHAFRIRVDRIPGDGAWSNVTHHQSVAEPDYESMIASLGEEEAAFTDTEQADEAGRSALLRTRRQRVCGVQKANVTTDVNVVASFVSTCAMYVEVVGAWRVEWGVLYT